MPPPHFPILGMIRMRKHRSIRAALLTVLVLIFFFAAYKVVKGFTDAKKEQDAFDELAAIVAQNSPASAQQTGQDAPSFESAPVPTSGIPKEDPPQNKPEGITSEEAAKETAPEPVILPQYLPLYERNPDFFGWLSIEGTDIDYPVMYTPVDPEHYLRRAFDGSYSGSGVPFVDGNCPADGSYYLIYGHHMNNGTMFGQLPEYQDEEFCKEHPVICFDTLYEQREYVVMAAFFSRIYGKNEQGVFRYYEYFDLSDPAVFEEYVRQVSAAALYDTGITAGYGDELLALSTCNYHTADGSFVVVAKRIS